MQSILLPAGDSSHNSAMLILGLETSCDETGIALYDGARGLLAHVLHSQAAVHARYGGVVPELASRDHIQRILPLIDEALAQAALEPADIEGVAYTAGPGLIGALLVGAAVGHSLAWAWQVPAIGVNHLEAHLLAPMLEPDPPTFPFVALLVSGGHTLLAEVAGLGRYRVLGESRDDAAGEAFDKVAKLLGLDYPGGPAVARLAEQGRPDRFVLPRPMTDRPGLDFSFSGLKTAVLNLWQRESPSAELAADLARAFEEAVVDTLVLKCQRALAELGNNNLVIAGGVGANQRLRQRLRALADTQRVRLYFPRPAFCTDNGAMIAYAGYRRLSAGQPGTATLEVAARWPLTDLNSP